MGWRPDHTRAAATARLLEMVQDGVPPPWRRGDILAPGLPRNGVNRRTYGGPNPLLLWVTAADQDAQSNLWYTIQAAERQDASLRDGVEPARIRGTVVYNHGAFDGLPPPPPRPHAEVAVRRVSELLGFLGVSVVQGESSGYHGDDDVIHVENGVTLQTPDGCAEVMRSLAGWSAPRMEVDAPRDWLAADIAGALLCAWLQLPAAPPSGAPDGGALEALIADDPAGLWDAFGRAQSTLRFVQDLAPVGLIEEIEDAARGDLVPADEASTAQVQPESVRSLGELLLIEEEELDRSEEVDSKPKRMVLGEVPGRSVQAFFESVATTEFGRRRPPVMAWVTGGAGTGRVQVLGAMRGLLRTGGTDLSAPWLDTEGDEGALLDAFGAVWSAPWIEVVACRLPNRFEARHDRAVPTACLRAFHVSRGLSSQLWMARLEHRLRRRGDFGAFVKAFEALAGKPWVGDANQKPAAFRERIVSALGGAAAGARRRLGFYERTRDSASWSALFEEVNTSLYQRATENGWGPDDPEPRVLFVIDISSAETDRDPAAIGWLGRVLAPLADQMDDLASRGTRPFWFLLCSESPVKRLANLAGWSRGAKRAKLHADLDRYPVTTAFNQDLLAKDPRVCRPVFSLYARHRRALGRLATLDGYVTPQPDDRDAFLAGFPFLPPVLPVAQAVLDTLVDDPGEADPRPLAGLVEHALAEHFFAPPDRFIPFDVLLEPVLLKLKADARKREGTVARAMVPFRDDPHRAFSHETVLDTLLLASRLPDLPTTARNLVSLMFVWFDRSVDDMVAEVQNTLDELVTRRFARVQDGRYHWVRGL